MRSLHLCSFGHMRLTCIDRLQADEASYEDGGFRLLQVTLTIATWTLTPNCPNHVSDMNAHYVLMCPLVVFPL